jgi:hypothetical protein
MQPDRACMRVRVPEHRAKARRGMIVHKALGCDRSPTMNDCSERRQTAWLSAARPTAPICSSGRISCHSVPTSDLISRADLADGIHPGRAGNDRIAKRVLMLMEERKVRR